MSRLRLQAQSKESKDPIRGDQLFRPYLDKGGIKTRRKEDPRDKAVGCAKEKAGATVTARNVQLSGKLYTQPGCQDAGPPGSGKEECRIFCGKRNTPRYSKH